MRFIIGVGLAVAAVTSLAIGAATAPAASPDRIVYHSKLAGGNNEILVVNAAGGAPTRLTRSPASDSNRPGRPTGRRSPRADGQGDGSAADNSDIYVDAVRRAAAIRKSTFSNAYDGDPAWCRE